MKSILKTCSRGHKFYKSSDCPTCPICWSGAKRKKTQSDFPEKLSAPALRALANAKVKGLKALSKHTEKEISGLHGMGPSGIKMLKNAMRKQKLSFMK